MQKVEIFYLKTGHFWRFCCKGEGREMQGRWKGEAREKDFVIKKEINP
jgi:hypothetical protein